MSATQIIPSADSTQQLSLFDVPHIRQFIDEHGKQWWCFADIVAFVCNPMLERFGWDGVDLFCTIPTEQTSEVDGLPVLNEDGLSSICLRLSMFWMEESYFWKQRFDMVPNAVSRTNQKHEYSEADIESVLCAALDERGIKYERQVTTSYGRIDVLTSKAIFEVKRTLTVHALKQAVGQLLAYNQAFPEHAFLVVVTEASAANKINASLVANLGVKVLGLSLDSDNHEALYDVFVAVGLLDGVN